jgi:hypothetical protein
MSFFRIETLSNGKWSATTDDFSLRCTGRWTLESNLAVYRHGNGNEDRYNQPALEAAILNVKNNRNFYATHEAYERDLFHFETGLDLFRAAEAAHQAT